MALEDIVKGYERYGNINGIAQGLSERGSDPIARATLYQELGKFIKKYEPDGAEGVDPIINDIINNERNTLAGQMIGEQSNSAQSNLIEKTSEVYTELINKMDPKVLYGLAQKLDSNIGKYAQLAQQVEEKNVDQAQAEFVKYYADKAPTIAKYISRIKDADLMKIYAANFLKNAKTKLEKQLSDEIEEKTEKGVKKKYILNPEKIKEYVLGKIESAKDKEKPSYYMALAETYVSSLKKK